MRWLVHGVLLSLFGLAPAAALAQAEPDSNASSADAGQMGGEDSEQPSPREGFLLRMSGTMGPAFLFSDANPLSGFAQPLATQTSGFGFGMEGELGFEITTGWLLGAYLGVAYASELRIHVKDRVATLDPGMLTNPSLGLAITFEPWRGRGYHFSSRVGVGLLEVTSEAPFEDALDEDIASRLLAGPQLSLIAGKEWRLHGSFWLGLALRFTYANLHHGADTGPGSSSTWLTQRLALTASWF